VAKTCSHPGCVGRPAARLSYVYAASQVEVSPLDEEPGVGTYVLCQSHLDRLRLPKGWTLVVRGGLGAASLTTAEIDQLAERIRRVGGVRSDGVGAEPEATETSLTGRSNLVTLAARAHLRVVADVSRYDATPARAGAA